MPLQDKNNSAPLNKFLRVVNSREPVFQTGEMGNTLFLILEGRIRIYEETHGESCLMGILNVGDLMGEKVLLSKQAFKREFTAIADGDTTLLEFESKHLGSIQAIMPDFALKVLTSNILKLQRANDLIRVLRTQNPIDRFLEYLLHTSKHYGTKTPQGVEIQVTPEAIALTTGVSKEVVDQCVEELVTRRAIATGKEGLLIRDEGTVKELAFHLKQQIAV